MRKLLLLFLFLVGAGLYAQQPADQWQYVGGDGQVHQYWFVRSDGGNRYDASLYTPGQCDGKANLAYPGSGTNQHCAFSDPRYLYEVGTYGNRNWVIQGGDTAVVLSCKALADQQNRDPNTTHCRIGRDNDGSSAHANDSGNFWGQGNVDNSIPPLPAGTAQQHTQLLGACAYGTYTCNPVNTYPYKNSNLTQLFAGFGEGRLFDLSASSYVDIEGFELTTHNGVCNRRGTTNPIAYCSTNAPLSDASDTGIVTGAGSNAQASIAQFITLQDVWIHGFSSNGLQGPVGQGIVLNRVAINFNTFAGWNMQLNGTDGVGLYNTYQVASLDQSYVTMVGNGCTEEYPIVHGFPAKGCWDLSSGGFGDAWSGQGSDLHRFTCDHCFIGWNVKDGALGPHTTFDYMALTNSVWVGNMGQAGKWGNNANSTTLVQNNLFLGNCLRMKYSLPGAAQVFDQSANIPGSGLSLYCRANGPLFDFQSSTNSTVRLDHNTFVTYQPIVLDLSCKPVDGGGSTSGVVDCSSTVVTLTNSLVYALQYNTNPLPPSFSGLPAVWYIDSDQNNATEKASLAGYNNLYYNFKNGTDYGQCGQNGNVCGSDPLMIGEPGVNSVPPDSVLDLYNFAIASGSPARGIGSSANAPTRSKDFTGATANNDAGALNFNSLYSVPSSSSNNNAPTPATLMNLFNGILLSL